LIIIEKGIPLRVEVTSGTRQKTGRLGLPPHVKTNFDIIAVVENREKITYIPEFCND
jgi:hypothetical protein